MSRTGIITSYLGSRLIYFCKARLNGLIAAAFVYRGGLLQCCEQVLSAIRHWYGLVENDGLGTDFFAVQVFVRAVVGSKSGTRKRDASEESSSARVGKNFGAQSDIRFRGGSTADP